MESRCEFHTYQVSPNVFLPNFNGTYNFAGFTNTGVTNVVTPDCTVAPGESLDPLSAFACNVPITLVLREEVQNSTSGKRHIPVRTERLQAEAELDVESWSDVVLLWPARESLPR